MTAPPKYRTDGTSAGEAVATLDLAVTERGKTIQFTDPEVDHCLKLLIVNGSRCKATAEMLEDEGISVTRDTLKGWRDRSFPRRFANLRSELTAEVDESLAGDLMENAIRADRVAVALMEKTLENADKISPDHLAKSVQAMAGVVDKYVEKSRLLRDRPTQINETRSIDELVVKLERLGVLERAPGEDVIDAQVIEDEMAEPAVSHRE